ncbi:hypothetical protein [Tautonia plasticadhaerens]|uniref:Uncharacterized protein n=1 Tax=Tautonia plasticadhaerens TaxID=2527974 RepID=A0A518H6G6_9BACT|nr:hypothetical protein [Tautonia plasticadhaerens]QDV36414.1 hypothetical protein ElP_43380 [Tautonia plasticadhaerens]
MGVEYVHYLIPEDNSFKPGTEDLIRLVDALLEGGFVAESRSDEYEKKSDDDFTYYEHTKGTGCLLHSGTGEFGPLPCPVSERDIAHLGERDYKLIWMVESHERSGLKYPLTPVPELFDPYYDLELRMAGDYVYHHSEGIDPFPDVACPCGRSLEYYEPDEPGESWKPPVYFDARISRSCPACGRPFRPQELVARVRDGRTGEVGERAGGATYRFAVVIDCGKGSPREGWPIRATEELLCTLTRALGLRFYEVGDFY